MSRQSSPGKDFIKEVLERYGAIASETLLNGFEWTIPITGNVVNDRKKFLELKLCVKKRFLADAHKISNGKRVYNLRRPNEKTTLMFECEAIRKKKYKFVPSKSFKKRLEDILMNTYHEYRTA